MKLFKENQKSILQKFIAIVTNTRVVKYKIINSAINRQVEIRLLRW